MSPVGWTIMIVSVVGMTVLFVWCIRKVLSLPDGTQHIHSQSDIDPHDQE